MYQQMKKHFSRYTPELVSNITGTPEGPVPQDRPDARRDLGARQGDDDLLRPGLDTAPRVGSQNIRTMAMIQLLLGNMGRPGGGVNALRGHANVQGITDMCAYSEVMSGYLSSPTDRRCRSRDPS